MGVFGTFPKCNNSAISQDRTMNHECEYFVSKMIVWMEPIFRLSVSINVGGVVYPYLS